MDSLDKKFCDKHPHMAIEYVCLAPECANDRGPLCPACSSALHEKCSKDFFMRQDEIESKVKVIKEGFDDSDLYDMMMMAMDSVAKDFIEQVTKHGEASKAITNREIDSLPAMLEFLKFHQPNYRVDFDSATKKIKISSIFKDQPQIKQAFIQRFDEQLTTLFDNVIKGFGCKKMPGSLDLKPPTVDDWLGHNTVRISLTEEEFKITCSAEQDHKAIIFYNEPLAEGTLFQIDVLAIDPEDRYLGLGIVDSAGYQAATQNNFEKWNAETFVAKFTGYDKSGHFEGRFPAQSQFDTKGLMPGSILYAEYCADQFEIYDDDRKISLKTAALQGLKPLYFFIEFAGKGTDINVERLL